VIANRFASRKVGGALKFDPIEQAARLIASADGLLILAGAGMGVDSGLPDFRGNEGFWKAYPALAKSGIQFTSIASPYAFKSNPKQAWGFYGHRLDLYRKTQPHAGFEILRSIATQMEHGAFVITSNVDGQFQKAGFDVSRVLEIHGSIHHLQCSLPCKESVWPANDLVVSTNDERCEWLSDLPTCPYCGAMARPNVLMFNDSHWVPVRQQLVRGNREVWANQPNSMVVVELGAGVDIPSIRRISAQCGSPVIRINPRHPELAEGAGVSLAMGALQALSLIKEALESSPRPP